MSPPSRMSTGRGPASDISWLSAFPGEKEVLFPPLTFLKPTGRAEVVEGYTFVEVAPTVA